MIFSQILSQLAVNGQQIKDNREKPAKYIAKSCGQNFKKIVL